MQPKHMKLLSMQLIIKRIKIQIENRMYPNQPSQLYQPLRVALDKSMVRDPNMQLAKSRIYEQVGATSRISRRMKSLSPQQANYIKSSTLLPVDRELVPTGNIWKVRGKQFSAVNVQVKQGPPIPASQMHIPQGMRGGNIITQTVYEMVPKQPQIRTLTNTRSITNLRTVYPPPQTRISIAQPPLTNRYTQQQYLQQRRPASQVRILNQPTIPPAYNSRIIQPIIPINSRNTITQHKIQQRVQNPSVEVASYKPNYSNQYYNQLQPAYMSNNTKKSKYKYNFFSALDEAINTKCTSCGPNQIIASKPLSSWQ